LAAGFNAVLRCEAPFADLLNAISSSCQFTGLVKW
jgi:hypothetical protein